MKMKKMPRHDDDRDGRDATFNDECRAALFNHLQMLNYSITLGKGQDRAFEMTKNKIAHKVLVKSYNVFFEDKQAGDVVAIERCLLQNNTHKRKQSDILRRKVDIAALALNFKDRLEIHLINKLVYKQWIESMSDHIDIHNVGRKCYNNWNPSLVCASTGLNVVKRSSGKQSDRLLVRVHTDTIARLAIPGMSYVGDRIETDSRPIVLPPTCF